VLERCKREANADKGRTMPMIKPSWRPNRDLAVGKSSTVQQFVASVGAIRLEIELAPWGEGTLKINGVQIAQVSDRKGRREAFGDLRKIAERHMRQRANTHVVRSCAH
jgi:enoyl-[acyl-carrier protein] reductase I